MSCGQKVRRNPAGPSLFAAGASNRDGRASPWHQCKTDRACRSGREQPSRLLTTATDALRQQYVPKAKSLVGNGAEVKGQIAAVRGPCRLAKRWRAKTPMWKGGTTQGGAEVRTMVGGPDGPGTLPRPGVLSTETAVATVQNQWHL